MTVSTFFAYPKSPHERRHAPDGYVDYKSFKPWLRDEFTFRCVYCLEREQWYPNRADAFSVDHVIPKSSAPKRACDYANLVYAWGRCNYNKLDVRLPDPTHVDSGDCLSVNDDGIIWALSADGANLIDVLHVNDSPAIDTRRKYIRSINLKLDYPQDAEVHESFAQDFGFPDDLPDLASMRPPRGNLAKSRRGWSYLELRRLNRLGETC
jgi:hypothetical protein